MLVYRSVNNFLGVSNWWTNFHQVYIFGHPFQRRVFFLSRFWISLLRLKHPCVPLPKGNASTRMPQPKLSLHLNQKKMHHFFVLTFVVGWPLDQMLASLKKVAGFEGKKTCAVFMMVPATWLIQRTVHSSQPAFNRRSPWAPLCLGLSFTCRVGQCLIMSQPSDQPHTICLGLRVLHSSSLWNLLLKWENSARRIKYESKCYPFCPMGSFVYRWSLFSVHLSVFRLCVSLPSSSGHWQVYSLYVHLFSVKNHYLKVYLSTYPVTHPPVQESYWSVHPHIWSIHASASTNASTQSVYQPIHPGKFNPFKQGEQQTTISRKKHEKISDIQSATIIHL